MNIVGIRRGCVESLTGEDVPESVRADLFEYAKAHSLWNPPSEPLYEQKLNPEDLLPQHVVSVDDVEW